MILHWLIMPLLRLFGLDTQDDGQMDAIGNIATAFLVLLGVIITAGCVFAGIVWLVGVL